MTANDRYSRELVRRPLPTLVLLCLFSGILFALIAAFFYWLLMHERINATASSAAGNLLDGVLSPAVALAGATSTVVLAVLGLRIVDQQEKTAKRQEHHDRIQYIESRLNQALAPIARLSTALSLLEASGRALIHTLESEAGRLHSGKTDGRLRTELNQVVKNLRLLDLHLHEIAVSPWAFALWSNRPTTPARLLARLAQRSQHPAATYELIDLIALFRSCVGQFDEPHATDEIERLQAAWSMADSQADRMREWLEQMPDPRGYVSLLLVGGLLWLKSERDIEMNYGAALVLDLVDAVPGVDEITEFCARLYDGTGSTPSGDVLPTVLREDARGQDPKRLLKPVLLEALKSFREKPDALFWRAR
jgi:hypothetical protein